MRRAGRVCALTALAFFAATGVLAAQQDAAVDSRGAAAPAVDGDDAELERRTRALASELRCPVCQGLSIEDSPTDLAREMRAVVREQLQAGRSEEEVRAYFVAKYGEWILLRPEATGFNLLVYVLPLLAVLGGGAVIALLVRRWMRAPRAAEDPLDPLDGSSDADEATAAAELNW